MRNTIFIATIFILAGLSSCKEECKTCPDGYGLVNDECECLGYINGGECYSSIENLITPYGGDISGDLYYSFDSNTSDNFVFNSSPQLIAITGWGETGVNSESAEISLVENKKAIAQQTLITTVKRLKGQDSAWFEPFRNENGFGPGRIAFAESKVIDGKTCYLRPYLVQLDSRLYRLHLKWETEAGEVVDICTKIFRK